MQEIRRVGPIAVLLGGQTALAHCSLQRASSEFRPHARDVDVRERLENRLQRDGRSVRRGAPRRCAVPDKKAEGAWSQRNSHRERIEEVGRRAWQKESGYRQQARAENAFFRWKWMLGDPTAVEAPRALQAKESWREAWVRDFPELSTLGIPSAKRQGVVRPGSSPL